ncbi:MAG: calcium-binding protein [Sedimentitalea sp.]
MPIVEIDTLQRVRDMEFLNGTATSFFPPGRITTLDADGRLYMVMGSEGLGLGVARIFNNGALEFQEAFATAFDRLDSIQFSTSGISSITKNGQTYVYLSGQSNELVNNRAEGRNGISVLEIDVNGDLDVVQQVEVTTAPGGGGAVSSFGVDPTIVNVGGRDMLITTSNTTVFNSGTFESFEIRNDGTLRHLRSSDADATRYEKFDVVEVGGKTFAIAITAFDQESPLQVFQINNFGGLRPVFDLPQSDQAIFNRVTTDVETVQIDGRAFVIMTESTAGTILVYEVEKSGALALVEQERPNSGDQWGFGESLEVFEIDGTYYVATGGYGRSFGVFEISKGGALTEVDEMVFSGNSGRVFDIEERDIGADQFLFLSMQGTDEIRSFRYVAQDTDINGNAGNNTRNGTEDDDQIFGKGGNDTLRGDAGDDMIEGGRGNDSVVGGDGEDNLFGGDGRDIMRGGDGYDFMFGEDGNDSLFGQDGNDYINGGQASDRVVGQDGNDVLFGGRGNDRVEGGTGNDRLTDGLGADQLTGGSGFDIFIFVQDGTLDIITDYEDGMDRIDLTDFGVGLEFSQLAITQVGNDVRIRVEQENILVKAADGQISDFELSLGDFIFA